MKIVAINKLTRPSSTYMVEFQFGLLSLRLLLSRVFKYFQCWSLILNFVKLLLKISGKSLNVGI